MNITKWLVTELNTYHNNFRGNFVMDISETANGRAYVFQRVNNEILDIEKVSYTPVAQTQDTPTPDVADKEAYDYIKSFVMPIKVENNFSFDETNPIYKAMMDFAHDYNGESVEIDNKKVSFKIVTPTLFALSKYSASWYAVFVLDIYMTVTSDQSYLGNEDVISIKRKTDAEYRVLKHISLEMGTGAETEPTPDVRTNERVKNINTRTSMVFSLTWFYYNHELEHELYDAMMGNYTGDDVYMLRKQFRGQEWVWEVGVSGTAYNARKGTKKRISLDFNEV